jgi:hypothetical protein
VPDEVAALIPLCNDAVGLVLMISADRCVRSAVTNGKRLHVVAPGDTKWARRFRDVLAEIISDLGGACLLREAWTC